MPLKAERNVKAPKRERHAVAERGNGRDLEQIEIDLGFSFLRPEPFYTQAIARAAKVRIEAVAVHIAMVLDLKRGTGRKPWGKSFCDRRPNVSKRKFVDFGSDRAGAPPANSGTICRREL